MTKVNFDDLTEIQQELVQMFFKTGSSRLGIHSVQIMAEGSFVVFN